MNKVQTIHSVVCHIQRQKIFICLIEKQRCINTSCIFYAILLYVICFSDKQQCDYFMMHLSFMTVLSYGTLEKVNHFSG